ncbi:MAG: hypothetical protein DDT36_01120 [Firmicutes bacterium]|nr:hypothetical protein [Bacillota bacterium]
MPGPSSSTLISTCSPFTMLTLTTLWAYLMALSTMLSRAPCSLFSSAQITAAGNVSTSTLTPRSSARKARAFTIFTTSTDKSVALCSRSCLLSRRANFRRSSTSWLRRSNSRSISDKNSRTISGEAGSSRTKGARRAFSDASGVRNSCEASATNLRRASSSKTRR